VHVHPVRQRLVRALVGAAQELGVEVVAEGVETSAELACLVGLGCDVFQGYLFAKPSPALTAPDFSGADA
jgi:EAL domain-containing protein (putative c-di-GMP-specific phosphodiesterase class I)